MQIPYPILVSHDYHWEEAILWILPGFFWIANFRLAQLIRGLFGGFLEHIGRAVYEGVYEPQSKLADENGFRQDVIGSLKKLLFTAMRYPGGNFASGYHWLDGVGPRNLPAGYAGIGLAEH